MEFQVERREHPLTFRLGLNKLAGPTSEAPKVVETATQERISERTVEPVQHFVKEILEATKDDPQKSILERTALRAPKRRNRQRNRHRRQSVSESEDEMDPCMRRLEVALLS